MHDIARWSLIELCEQLSRRKLSAVELMQAVLGCIETKNAEVNALVAMRDPDALLSEARRADTRLTSGRARPLEGIPCGVKDLEDATGLVTSHGSRLFGNAVAQRDEIHVARLRAAGAIVVGKTNVPEFGTSALTKNLLHGVTRSPWNPERTPGGSSGGSAAALVSGMLPLVTASDAGGSIRIPAAWSGAFGLKPSRGRVPVASPRIWDASQVLVCGPLTKTVQDAALLVDLLTGPAPEDPSSLPQSGYSFLERTRNCALPKLTIGLSLDLGHAQVQAEIGAAVEASARVYESLGHEIRTITGWPPPAGDAWMSLVAWELAAKLRRQLPAARPLLARYLQQALRQAREMGPTRWGEIQERRAAVLAWCARTFADVDLLLTPTTPYEAPAAGGPFPGELDSWARDPNAAGLFTIPFSLTWNPGASVRAGMTGSGLPIGMQIVGPFRRDDVVLQAARAFERERPWHPDWPIS